MATNARGLILALALLAGWALSSGGSSATQAPLRPAAQLQAGMQLVYASGDSSQPPWTVDSVRHDVKLRPGAECAMVHLRRVPQQAQVEETRLCLARDTLYRWEALAAQWAISRPVGPGMVWTEKKPGGKIVRYETGAAGEERISGMRVPVVPTTVTTSDSLGQPVVRLRERYALTLTTATGGIFETRDTSAAGGWRTRQTFELREIRVP